MKDEERMACFNLEIYRLDSIVQDLEHIRNQLAGELRCKTESKKIDIAISKIVDVTEILRNQIDWMHAKAERRAK